MAVAAPPPPPTSSSPAPSSGGSPFADVQQDYSIFGPGFTATWHKWAGGGLAILTILAGLWLAYAIFGLRAANKSHIPGQVADEKKQVLWAGVSFGILSIFSTFVFWVWTAAALASTT